MPEADGQVVIVGADGQVVIVGIALETTTVTFELPLDVTVV